MSRNPKPFAFPFPDVRDVDGCGIREGSSGMTLRDWFAGQALAAAINAVAAGKVPLENWIGTPSETAAFISYIMADAMLAERAKEQQQ